MTFQISIRCTVERSDYYAVCRVLSCGNMTDRARSSHRHRMVERLTGGPVSSVGVCCSLGSTVLYCSTVLYPSRRRFLSILDAACYASTTLRLQQLVTAGAASSHVSKSHHIRGCFMILVTGQASHCQSLLHARRTCGPLTNSSCNVLCVLFVAFFFSCCVNA